MYVRLGFSIAVTVDPEILIVDEIIAVGDEEFQRKCFDYMFELRKRGTTIVLVTHSLGLVQDMCDHALWLERGRVQRLGDSRDVVQGYLDSVNLKEAESKSDPSQITGTHVRRGSGEIRIESVEYLDGSGKVGPVLLCGEPATFRVSYRATERVPDVMFGLGFLDESGITVAGPNSGSGKAPVSNLFGTGVVEFHVPRLHLQPGVYEVSVAAVNRGHTFDYVDRGYELRVRGNSTAEPGLTRMFGEWVAGTSPHELVDDEVLNA
jgi:ABC-2 type transport system ATP-binding protein/lipopolysaccharide transport system ATP-binding protein